MAAGVLRGKGLIQGLNSFSQGSVTDVERSKGGSVRLIAPTKQVGSSLKRLTRSQYVPATRCCIRAKPVPYLPDTQRSLCRCRVDVRAVIVDDDPAISLNFAFRHEQVIRSSRVWEHQPRPTNTKTTSSLRTIVKSVSRWSWGDHTTSTYRVNLQSLTRSKQYSVALPTARLGRRFRDQFKLLPRLSSVVLRITSLGGDTVNGGFENDPGRSESVFN